MANFIDVEYIKGVTKDSTKSRLLSDAEVKEMSAAGKLPPMQAKEGTQPRIYMVNEPTLKQEFIVMLMERKCGCARMPNGKMKRCKKHERRRKAKKRAAPGMVQDDNSDRMMVSNLKKVDASEDEDEPILGAYTPGLIYTLGACGIPTYVHVYTDNNPNAAPRCPKDIGNIDGILVRGPMDCPQFIPADKIQKKNGDNQFTNFTKGKLIRNEANEHVFVADDGPQLGAAPYSNDLQKKLLEANTACTAEIGPKGMPEMRVIAGAQKNADAPMGVIVTEANKNYFVQVAGSGLGAGETAQYLVTYDPNAPPGTLLAKVQIKDGQILAFTPAQAAAMKGQKFNGTVVMGSKGQPNYVPGDKQPTKAEIDAAMARINALQAKMPEIFNADAEAKSKMGGIGVEEAKQAILEADKDAQSVEFVNAGEGYCTKSVFMTKGGGGGGGGAPVAGASTPGPVSGNDPANVAFGQNGNRPKSAYYK